MYLLFGKGNKERTIYLNKACKDTIEAYLKERSKLKELEIKHYL